MEDAQVFANEEWCRLTGYTKEELRRIPYFDLIHPRYRDDARDRYRRRLRGEQVPILVEISIVRKDGVEVPVEGIGAYTTYLGKPANVAYMRDITERKQTEQKVFEYEEVKQAQEQPSLHGFPRAAHATGNH